MLTFLGFAAAAAEAGGFQSKSLRLNKMADPESNSQYRKVLAVMDNKTLLEPAKILYLVTQLKLSPYQFERNESIYDGGKAASHLLMKYSAVRDRIETAEQFIDYIASRSSKSGRPYHVLDANGKRYLSHDVLINELAELEASIEKKRQRRG